MACGGVALALYVHIACVRQLEGSVGMLPWENFGFLDRLRASLVHFRG